MFKEDSKSMNNGRRQKMLFFSFRIHKTFIASKSFVPAARPHRRTHLATFITHCLVAIRDRHQRIKLSLEIDLMPRSKGLLLQSIFSKLKTFFFAKKAMFHLKTASLFPANALIIHSGEKKGIRQNNAGIKTKSRRKSGKIMNY